MGIESRAVTYLACNKIVVVREHSDDFSDSPRPHYIFAYVAEGKITCRTARETVVGEVGEIVFIPYRCCYHLHWHSEPKTVVYSCYFNFPALSEPFETRTFPLQKLLGFRDVLCDFEYLQEALPHADTLFQVLGRFYHLLHRLFPSLVCTRVKPIDERIRCAISYLDANYDNKLTVDELAAECHVSPSRFYHLFKKETGMSPISYKNILSIRAAEQLLIGGKMSVEEISGSVGFSSAAYFRRVFREVTGKSPQQYRKKGLGL